MGARADQKRATDWQQQETKRGEYPEQSLVRMGSRSALLALQAFVCLTLAAGSWEQADTAKARALLAANQSTSEYFVRIVNGNFVLGCKKFIFGGWNQWEVVEESCGARQLAGSSLPWNFTGPMLVRQQMDAGVSIGFSVVRMWAHGISPHYALETSPGVYSEPVFRGMDYALDQARQRDLKVIMSLSDNWGDTGGIDEFVRWSGNGNNHEVFYADAKCRQLYKDRVATVVSRVNSINGRTYRDDPTIMAWNLMNEPRCYKCGPDLQAWIHDMAAYVKSLDRNHLLTVGEEGFYGSSDTSRTPANPNGSGTWAQDEGQDFPANHNLPDIDFVTLHIWPDSWLTIDETWMRKWIRQHAADASQLGRPAVIEEFGKWIQPGTAATQAQRDAYFQIVYDELESSAKSGGPLQGSLFWQWYGPQQNGPLGEGGAEGVYGLRETDSTFASIKSNAKVMQGLSTGIPSCSAQAAPVPSVNTCQGTWVNGVPGTGYEGPGCNIDVNECTRGTDSCQYNAGCFNTPGNFQCNCWWGYAGSDGNNCTRTQAVDALSGIYVTDGPGMLACHEGQDVAYPPGSPGFGYDSTSSQPVYGSAGRVALEDCMVACETATSCDSFSFNPVMTTCFLKSGGDRKTCQAQEQQCAAQDGRIVSTAQEKHTCGRWQTYYRQGSRGDTKALSVAG